MITFDNLLVNGATVFDDLDEGAIDAYTQVGTPSIVLSGAATQSYVGAYDQDVTVEIVFDSTGSQEYVSPSGVPAYLQSANAQMVTFAGGVQEYIAVAGGQWGQTGNIVLLLSSGSVQAYLDADLQIADVALLFSLGPAFQEHITAGGAITEQDGSVSLTFPCIVLHDWEDPYSGPKAYSLQPMVAGIVDGMTAFPLSISPPLPTAPEYFYLKFTSAANEWLTNSGLGGEPVGAELLLNDVPFVSVTPEQDFLVVEQHVQPAFNQLYDALIAGEADIKIRSFERFANFTLNQPLRAESMVRLRAYY